MRPRRSEYICTGPPLVLALLDLPLDTTRWTPRDDEGRRATNVTNGADPRKRADKAIKIALTGTPRQAKFAARYLAYAGQEDASAKLVKNTIEALEAGPEDKLLLTHLRALTEIALHSPAALEERAEDVHRFVMDEVLMKASPIAEVGSVSLLWLLSSPPAPQWKGAGAGAPGGMTTCE